MRGWTGKRDQRLEAKRTHREVTRQSLRLEIPRLIVELTSGYENRGTDYCGSVGPCRSGRGNTLAAHRGAAAMDIEGGRGPRVHPSFFLFI
jgi:hypothetical protein